MPLGHDTMGRIPFTTVFGQLGFFPFKQPGNVPKIFASFDSLGEILRIIYLLWSSMMDIPTK